ncbi:MAG: hypothetical protein PVH29_04290 [Candidatus Zixiibacteriota bacterium]|jgi:hypothetical protein
MRFVSIALLLLGLAAIVHSECEFPYYPEYADVYSRYDEVTPEMAVAAVGAWPGTATFAKPLLLRDVNGMPFCYMVEAFPPGDADLVARWNGVIAKVNAGERIPAAELAAELEALYDVEYPPFRFGEPAETRDGERNPLIDFAGAVVSTFTFDNPRSMLGAGGGPPFPALHGYAHAYREAATRYGGGFYLSRIIGTGPYHSQIFEFENDAGEKVALAVDAGYAVSVADLEERDAAMRERVRKKYESIKNDDTWAEANRADWREIVDGLDRDEP